MLLNFSIISSRLLKQSHAWLAIRYAGSMFACFPREKQPRRAIKMQRFILTSHDIEVRHPLMTEHTCKTSMAIEPERPKPTPHA